MLSAYVRVSVFRIFPLSFLSSDQTLEKNKKRNSQQSGHISDRSVYTAHELVINVDGVWFSLADDA